MRRRKLLDLQNWMKK
uniref:Uncharacterized protein n=1 Tax=Arundo donax TaxID=35708 RepID=A0A0A9FPQ6_ARUDO